MNLTVAKALYNWKASEDEEFIESIDKYLQGDHYQDGAGWIGPVPNEGKVEDRLKNTMVTNNIFITAINRALLAVIGSEPYWDVVPKNSESENNANQELINITNQANDLLTQYFDNKRLQKIFVKLALSLISKNRAVVRIYLPDDALLEEDIFDLSDISLIQNQSTGAQVRDVVFKDIESAIDCLSVQVVHLSSSGFLKDTDERVVGAFYKYIKHSNTIDKTETEVVYVDRNTGKTIIEILDSSGKIQDDLKTKIDLQKHFTIFEIDGAGLVRKDILSQQKAIDHNETMLLMNNSYAGFRERLFLNAEPPTTTIEKAGKKFEVEAPLNVGAGTSQFIQGTAIEDPVTRDLKGYSNPNVIYKDPVDQTGLINSIKHGKSQILENMFQAHIQISGDATASGTSRVQAVQDHVSSLKLIEQEMNSVIRWCMETLLHYSAYLVKKEGYFKDVKVISKCIVSAILPTPEERAKLLDEYNAHLRSKEATQQLLGIEDTAAENAKIDEEQNELMNKGVQDIISGQNLDANGNPIVDPNTQLDANGNSIINPTQLLADA